MKYTHLGRTGLTVSRFCLGTANVGPYINEEDAHNLLSQGLALGINFIDTANSYGGQLGEGIAEQIIGRWLAEDKSRRRQIVLATKVYSKMGEGPNEAKLSAYHIKRACEDSLRRLQTDHIDLYQMHHIDRNTPWEEIWQAMEQLVREGKVLYVGSSNFAGWHIARANEVAARRNFMGLVSEQSKYSLNVRDVELEVLPACEAYGLGVIPYSPLGGGLLGGALQKITEGRRATERAQQLIDEHRPQLEQWEALCAELGHHPAHVALAWLLHNPAITGPILGPRTVEQLTSSMPALEIELSEDTLAKIDAVWPGPGGPAPEAYAW